MIRFGGNEKRYCKAGSGSKENGVPDPYITDKRIIRHVEHICISSIKNIKLNRLVVGSWGLVPGEDLVFPWPRWLEMLWVLKFRGRAAFFVVRSSVMEMPVSLSCLLDWMTASLRSRQWNRTMITGRRSGLDLSILIYKAPGPLWNGLYQFTSII
jgi:hypothetical protein